MHLARRPKGGEIRHLFTVAASHRAVSLHVPMQMGVVTVAGGTAGRLSLVFRHSKIHWAQFSRIDGRTLARLTHADLANGTTAIGTGDVVTAAKAVADAAAINVGTGVQIGTRAVGFVPMTLGADLDILGGGATSWEWWPSLPSSTHAAPIKLAAWQNLVIPNVPRRGRCWWSTSVRNTRS